MNIQIPKRLKHKSFTKKQYQEWQIFKLNRSIQLNKQQIKYIVNLYNEIFNKPLQNTEIKNLILMIDRLDVVCEKINK